MADGADDMTPETMSVSEDPDSLERGQGSIPTNREKVENDQTGQNHDLSDSTEPWDWETDPDNPYNWPASRKAWQIATVSSMAFTACVFKSTKDQRYT